VLVVDGTNVVGSVPDGWWRDRPGAYARLVRRLASLGEPVTVVFDGPPFERTLGEVEVRVVRYADDLLASLAGDDVRLVTSDRELADRARAAGADVVGTRWLLDRLDAG
jgi:8-oxo-dGTP diphosphatase